MSLIEYKRATAINGDVLWEVNDINGSAKDIHVILEKFISEYSNQFKCYFLCIHDSISKIRVEIDLPIKEIPNFLAHMYNHKNASKLEYIRLNSVTKSIDLKISLSRKYYNYFRYYHNIRILRHKLENGKLSPKSSIRVPVTRRIEQIKQPYGGFIKPKDLTVEVLGDGIDALNPNESIHATIVGLTIDYMTRFMLGASVEDAFAISAFGAKLIKEEKKAKKLVDGIKGLNRSSVVNAVKLCGFDVCYRAGKKAYKPVDDIIPDDATVENIITMVNRSLKFFEIYGPIVLDGFTFEGGYTDIVSDGDGDYLTKDTLWDFKVSKNPIRSQHTLQLLMYWRMGLHSKHPEFKNIQYLGIFNPRQNTVSRIAVADISDTVIKVVETDVIGYKE